MRPAVYSEFGILARHLRFANRATNKLGRSLFHAMVRFGPKLERRQMVLFRAVDIGAELYAMAAACARAQMLAKQGQIIYDFTTDRYRYRPALPVALSEEVLGPEPPEVAASRTLTVKIAKEQLGDASISTTLNIYTTPRRPFAAARRDGRWLVK